MCIKCFESLSECFLAAREHEIRTVQVKHINFERFNNIYRWCQNTLLRQNPLGGISNTVKSLLLKRKGQKYSPHNWLNKLTKLTMLVT